MRCCVYVMSTSITLKLPTQPTMLRVTGPVRFGPNKEKRRRRIDAALDLMNLLHKDTLERLAK